VRVSVFADLQGLCFNEAPQETVPSTVLVTPYRPDIGYYSLSSSMGFVELTCPLDSKNTSNRHVVGNNRGQNICNYLPSWTV